jgi:putative polyhydroxyalkanoate system protein
MADIEVRRVHNLGLEGARRTAEQLAADLSRKFGLSGEWDGDVLNFQRPGVTGSLEIDAKALRLAVSLGFLLKAMKGSIEQAVLAELDRALPAKAQAAPKKAPAKAKPKKAPPRPKKGA